MLVLDRKARRQSRQDRESFDRVRRAERTYTVQLRKIARNVGDIVKGFPPLDPQGELQVRRALQQYAQLIEPWSRSVAASMLADVSQRDMRAWRRITSEMGHALREEIANAPTGEVMRRKMAEQVALITSLPLEAAQRVHHLTIEGLSDATRAEEIAKEILRSGEVTESRANLIARTEVGRASSALTEARALHIDSPGYFWRTSKDSDVRPSHKKLEGKFIAWDKPPTTEGMTYHAGAGPNCRCYPEVVLPPF